MSRIVAFGDSITRGYGVAGGEGWVERLPALLPGCTIANAGGNGNTSREGLGRFEQDVLPALPALVLIEFGGNDAVHDARAVDVEEFAGNLREMHRRITDAGGATLFTTFPPIIDAWHAFHADPWYATWGGLDRYVARYRQRTREVAAGLGRPLFDLDRILRDRLPTERERLISADGIHLTAFGNAVAAGEIAAFLRGLGWPQPAKP